MLSNANPQVYEKREIRDVSPEDFDLSIEDEVDQREIFDLIRNINDPEHPLTLEELNVVDVDNIEIDGRNVKVMFTPTIPHCSMATLIGLCIRVKLLRTLSRNYKVDVVIYPGTHFQEHAINKQLNDKERIAAALDNPHLLKVVNDCLTPSLLLLPSYEKYIPEKFL